MTPMATSTRRAFVTVALLALAGLSAAPVAAGITPAAANGYDWLESYEQQLAGPVVPN
jgi:hypothetical protein